MKLDGHQKPNTSIVIGESQSKSSSWIQSAVWDSIIVLSGLWLVALAIGFRLVVSENVLTVPGAFIAIFTLSQIHLAAPIFLVVTSPIFKTLRKIDSKNYLWPVLIISVASFALFALGLHFQEIHFFQFLGLAFLVWNTWHFAMQNFGILTIYSQIELQRNGRKVGSRSWDRWHCLIQGFVFLPPIWWYSAKRLGFFLELLPQGQSDIQKQVALAAVILSLVFTAVMIFREFKAERANWPRILYFISMGIQPISGFVQYLPYHVLAYTLPHYIIEVGFMVRIQSNFLKASAASPTNFISKRLRIALFLSGIALSAALVKYAHQYKALGYFDQVGSFPVNFLESYSGNWAFIVLASMTFTIFFSHFYLSRLVYSFHVPIVGQQIWSLLTDQKASSSSSSSRLKK